jgi:NitT/TauT family transport system permease protein/sulfonate transport system permease protein
MVSWDIAARARRSGWTDHALAKGAVVAALLGWTAMAQRLPSFIMPSPWQVLEATGRLLGNPSLLTHLLSSTFRVIAAVGISLVLGFMLALLARNVAPLEWIVTRRVQPFLNAFPSVGWAILAAIWFNFNNVSVIFVEVAILLPLSLGTIFAGLRELDQEMVEMGWSFTRQRRRVFVKLYLPLLMPYIIAALRNSYGICWKIALVAELTGVETGLGYLMLRAQAASDVALILAICFVVVAIFIIGERALIDPLARHWRKLG